MTWGKNFPHSWKKFKGYTADKVTPMGDIFLETLHARMKYDEVVMELIRVATERVEQLHNGLGVYFMAINEFAIYQHVKGCGKQQRGGG